jgi:hypothetical protein
MGYEVTFVYHPRKEEGGYDTEKTEEKIVKVGKPFDDTPLEKLAASIMTYMARRDILVVDVKAVELIRKEVSFKECKDGKGIILKNKRFSFNGASEMIADDLVEEQSVQPQQQGQALVQVPQQLPASVQSHELVVHQRQQQQIEDLYSNPNKPVPVIKQNSQTQQPINPKKVLYEVYFEPYFYEAEVKRLGLRFTPDKKYPVHQIVPDPKGRLDNQKIAVTDDIGKIVVVDEKYFTSAGLGLMADSQLNFSGPNGRGVRKPKLAYENEMFTDATNPRMAGAIPQGIPIDDGTIPKDLLSVPDIRPGRKTK